MEGVAGPHRLQPAQIVDAGTEQRMRPEWPALRGKPHGKRRRLPSRSGEAAEDRVLRGFLVEMKRLRIVLSGEAEDILLRHRHLAALEAHPSFRSSNHSIIVPPANSSNE